MREELDILTEMSMLSSFHFPLLLCILSDYTILPKICLESVCDMKLECRTGPDYMALQVSLSVLEYIAFKIKKIEHVIDNKRSLFSNHYQSLVCVYCLVFLFFSFMKWAHLFVKLGSTLGSVLFSNENSSLENLIWSVFMFYGSFIFSLVFTGTCDLMEAEVL